MYHRFIHGIIDKKKHGDCIERLAMEESSPTGKTICTSKSPKNIEGRNGSHDILSRRINVNNIPVLVSSIHHLRLSQNHPPRLILLHPFHDSIRGVSDEFLVRVVLDK